MHTDSLSHSPASFPVFLVSLLLFFFMVSFWMPGFGRLFAILFHPISCSSCLRFHNPICCCSRHMRQVCVLIGVDIFERLWITYIPKFRSFASLVYCSLHVDLDWQPFTYFTCGEDIAEVGHLELIFTSCIVRICCF